MVWMIPAVAALLAAGVSTAVVAVDTDAQASDTGLPAASGWDLDAPLASGTAASNLVIDEADGAAIKRVATGHEVESAGATTASPANLRNPESTTVAPGENGDASDPAELASEAMQPEAEPAPGVLPGPALDPVATRQLEIDLDLQYQKLRRTLETEDSYSLQLAEDYFGYGSLLRQAARYEEALEAYTDSLHIEKINHGIYALEQRPSLKAMFEMHYAMGNTEEYEDLLERILWIETKNPQVRDDFAFDLLVMVGNQYIDQFLRRPLAGQASVQILLRAKHHLISALQRYRDMPLTENLLPYGELALISFLESRVLPDLDINASMEDTRLQSSRNLQGRQVALSSYLSDSFSRGELYLKRYLNKAQDEKFGIHVVYALTGLGDLHQLFQRPRSAQKYYELAWQAARDLAQDENLLASFSQPVALPNFQYSLDRQPIVPKRSSVLVPLKLRVGKDGKVEEVDEMSPDNELARYFGKARKMARRLIFRPQLADGKAVLSDQINHEIRIYAK